MGGRADHLRGGRGAGDGHSLPSHGRRGCGGACGAILVGETHELGVIRVQDEAGDDKAAFEVTRAWPCKYDPTDLKGTGNEVAIDTLELCNEGIRRIQ